MNGNPRVLVSRFCLRSVSVSAWTSWRAWRRKPRTWAFPCCPRRESGGRRQVRRLGPFRRRLRLRRRGEHARQVRRLVPRDVRRREPLPAGPLDRRDAAEQSRAGQPDRMGSPGDCLQVRDRSPPPGKPQELGNHFTCWRDRNGEDMIFVEVGKDFKGGTIKDAKTRGAKQAFHEERRRQRLHPGDRRCPGNCSPKTAGRRGRRRNNPHDRRAEFHHRPVQVA